MLEHQTDLVIAARARMGADQRVPAKTFDDLELCDRGAGNARIRPARHQHAARFRRCADPQINLSTIGRDDALDTEVKAESQDAFDIDVRRCRYAEFYNALGEPELGFLLVCSADYHMAEGFGPEIKLTRTQTIMRGASHCDFRYRRSRAAD